MFAVFFAPGTLVNRLARLEANGGLDPEASSLQVTDSTTNRTVRLDFKAQFTVPLKTQIMRKIYHSDRPAESFCHSVGFDFTRRQSDRHLRCAAAVPVLVVQNVPMCRLCFVGSVGNLPNLYPTSPGYTAEIVDEQSTTSRFLFAEGTLYIASACGWCLKVGLAMPLPASFAPNRMSGRSKARKTNRITALRKTAASLSCNSRSVSGVIFDFLKRTRHLISIPICQPKLE